MQNWKIKKMSYKELISQLKAVNRLLYYYQQGKGFPGTCKLCRAASKFHPKALGKGTVCPNCLWVIIEGESCAGFANRKYVTVQYVPCLTDTARWHTYRIPMLRRWRQVLKAERDSRTTSVEA